MQQKALHQGAVVKNDKHINLFFQFKWAKTVSFVVSAES